MVIFLICLMFWCWASCRARRENKSAAMAVVGRWKEISEVQIRGIPDPPRALLRPGAPQGHKGPPIPPAVSSRPPVPPQHRDPHVIQRAQQAVKAQHGHLAKEPIKPVNPYRNVAPIDTPTRPQPPSDVNHASQSQSSLALRSQSSAPTRAILPSQSTNVHSLDRLDERNRAPPVPPKENGARRSDGDRDRDRQASRERDRRAAGSTSRKGRDRDDRRQPEGSRGDRDRDRDRERERSRTREISRSKDRYRDRSDRSRARKR